MPAFMGSREDILSALRKAAPAQAPLPELPRGAAVQDLHELFAARVVEAGGRCLRVPKFSEELLGDLRRGRVVSLDAPPQGDPHALHDVECCIVHGDFGVAENGAVWITQHGGEQRAALFLTQHLVIVVSELVPTLHEAYERVKLSKGFGLFISGPSKTADIEQALVIGAHGARSCTVYLVAPVVIPEMKELSESA